MSRTSKIERIAYILSWIVNFIPTAFLTLCPKFISNRIRWCPTSDQELESAELMVFLNLKQSYELEFVNIGKCCGKTDNFIRTISLNKTSDNTPLVLLHGFPCATGYWVKNLDKLSMHRPVYALDLLGFGRSSRPQFSNDAEEIQTQFIASLEMWRKAVGLNKFILLGHDVGGYIAASYAKEFPERIALLILANPWGIEEKRIQSHHHYEMDLWVKFLDTFFQGFNFLALIRLAGPFGPYLVKLCRQDLKKKFAMSHMDPKFVIDYLYHCNVQNPSGEAAYKAMTDGSGYAQHPIMNDIIHLKRNLPITFVYGSRSWIDRQPGLQIKFSRLNAFVGIQIVEGAGILIHADKPDNFNNLINKICQNFDQGLLLPRDL
ncbi:1-acylglycerol-3-phosphate O-acyltransferase ABHD5 [Parasteatoda tepidariorum]|uniref:1-acylglycerol-3-phosphate O-acyltransferase ABHD5 n=1 Tax=Parasteatoda tepidariorum TaxID=114398 RepID=UPI00077FA5B0|nr:1-acylglycerol-3-phosphate O-acyltransferase ABHD5 [Parasteatoda tepidariorum]XP_015919854.1 1-acylglycerol-3-phosphate O-acyltransferase ABHD5 [Parasteatoda tepidariorum]XP_015919861.1 1-acylglycerol-3-phosphate O-acyltransferase ABHD5 [Parasteatoda tepidariorum]XP_015919867.1 1-acylglycerol-3-phosphate O-acyltransferase ABHD5 [Parasteatoda tepidariorum]